MKGFKVFILPDPCFIQCVMHVVRNSLILPGEFYSSHTQLSVSILRRRTRRVFYIFTFKMGAIKTDRPVRINTRVPVTLCSLKPNQKITNLPLVFINMLLSLNHTLPSHIRLLDNMNDSGWLFCNCSLILNDCWLFLFSSNHKA